MSRRSRLFPRADTTDSTGRRIDSFAVSPLGASPLGSATIAYLGDSHVAGAFGTYVYTSTFPLMVGLISQQKLVSVGYHGVGGERLDQMLARVSTALARRPNFLLLEGGTNDIGQAISNWSGGYPTTPAATVAAADRSVIASIASNVQAIVAAAIKVGATPVLCAVPPNNSAGARQRLILKANIWLRRYAARNGFPFVDFYPLLAKDGISQTPAGNGKTEYAQDGTHFNAAGNTAMANLVVQAILNRTPPSPPLATDLVGAGTGDVWMMSNSLFQNAAGDPKKPDNFTAYGAATSSTTTLYSLVTDPLVPGKMQRIEQTTSASNIGALQSVSSGSVSAGDVIAIAGYVTSDGAAPCEVQILCGSGPTYKPVSLLAGQPVTRGLYYMEFVAPAAGQITVNLIASRTSGVASVVDFGYPSVVNLTAAIGETTPMSPN